MSLCSDRDETSKLNDATTVSPFDTTAALSGDLLRLVFDFAASNPIEMAQLASVSRTWQQLAPRPLMIQISTANSEASISHALFVEQWHDGRKLGVLRADDFDRLLLPDMLHRFFMFDDKDFHTWAYLCRCVHHSSPDIGHPVFQVGDQYQFWKVEKDRTQSCIHLKLVAPDDLPGDEGKKDSEADNLLKYDSETRSWEIGYRNNSTSPKTSDSSLSLVRLACKPGEKSNSPDSRNSNDTPLGVRPSPMFSHNYSSVFEPDAWRSVLPWGTAIIAFHTWLKGSHYFVHANTLSYALALPVLLEDQVQSVLTINESSDEPHTKTQSILQTAQQAYQRFMLLLFRKNSARWYTLRYYLAVAADVGDGAMGVTLSRSLQWQPDHRDHRFTERDGALAITIDGAALDPNAPDIEPCGTWHCIIQND